MSLKSSQVSLPRYLKLNHKSQIKMS